MRSPLRHGPVTRRRIERRRSGLQPDALPTELASLGGDDPDRTGNLVLAKHLRSQLRHIPLERPAGLEPAPSAWKAETLPFTPRPHVAASRWQESNLRFRDPKSRRLTATVHLVGCRGRHRTCMMSSFKARRVYPFPHSATRGASPIRTGVIVLCRHTPSHSAKAPWCCRLCSSQGATACPRRDLNPQLPVSRTGPSTCCGTRTLV